MNRSTDPMGDAAGDRRLAGAGGTQRIMEGTRSDSIKARSTPAGPTSSCPKTSSRDCGRIRSARGAARLVLARLTKGWEPESPSVGRASDSLLALLVLAAASLGELCPGPSSKDLFNPFALLAEPFTTGWLWSSNSSLASSWPVSGRTSTPFASESILGGSACRSAGRMFGSRAGRFDRSYPLG